jgi:hypothetical protein
LHQHIERLRARLADYPVVVDRRVSKRESAVGYTTSENAVNQPTITVEDARRFAPLARSCFAGLGEKGPDR